MPFALVPPLPDAPNSWRIVAPLETAGGPVARLDLRAAAAALEQVGAPPPAVWLGEVVTRDGHRHAAIQATTQATAQMTKEVTTALVGPWLLRSAGGWLTLEVCPTCAPEQLRGGRLELGPA